MMDDRFLRQTTGAPMLVIIPSWVQILAIVLLPLIWAGYCIVRTAQVAWAHRTAILVTLDLTVIFTVGMLICKG